MASLAVTMKSVIHHNFDPFQEPLQVHFTDDGTREVEPFSVKYTDGFTKGLICQGIVGLVDSLETWLCFF